jgi:hypothetical protein
MTEARYVHQDTSLLFPTPLLTYQIADAERINALMLQEIEARRQSEQGVARSNRSGWHSDADLFTRSEPGHRALALAIRETVGDATLRIGKNPARLQAINYRFKGWVNVNPTHAYNAGAPDDEVGGAITFIDPRCAPAGQPLVQAPMFKGGHNLQPAPGTLLLFPSNAKHWVHPNSAEADRVTVAFNVFVSRQRGAALP